MKKIGWFLVFLGIIVIVWYLFIKEEHYRISFTTSQPPGIVFQHIKDWPAFGTSDSLEIEENASMPYKFLEHKVTKGDSLHSYQWKITPKNDSITKVVAYVKDLNNPWKQKFNIPFGNTNFVKRSLKNVENVGKELIDNATFYKVGTIKDTVLPGTFCAYISVESTVNNKAQNMLRDINLVMPVLKDYGIPLSGPPFLEIKDWNQQNDSISFDFCFPIEESDSLPKSPYFGYKTTPSKKALKTIFNGNYRISGTAWHHLLEFAQRNKIEITPTPIELFLNDPHQGGESLQWEAHILVPLK